MKAHIFLFIIVIFTVHCEEEIGLPEYNCDKNGDMTTIRLWTKNTQTFDYKFDVNFQTISQKCQNQQRCTLINWKSVRDLNNYLRKYPLGKLQTGLVLINNTMLIPGIKYILNVKILNAGNPIDEKTLILFKQNDTKPEEFLLLAPDTYYAHSILVINARVNICTNLTAYYFIWELTSRVGNSVFPSHSSELIVPPNTFQALENYTIWCRLVSQDGISVSKVSKRINVLSKGLVVRLPVNYLTAKSGQTVRIRAILHDFDNTVGELKIVWDCLETNTGDKCDVTSDNNELEMEFTPGLYEISVQVTKNNFSETDSCTVEVKSDVPVVEFEEIEFPVNMKVEIYATIYELKSFCTLQWTSPDLDLSIVPGNVINVTIKEDLFLNELEEYSNETFDRKFNLIIPPTSDYWEGLKGDAKYLFRLVIKCPTYDETNETESVLTTNDVIIETNAPPTIQQLNVNPLEGDAFLTTYTFTTLKAQDKDGPILYKFGYNLENRDVILCNMVDVTNCDASLPYSDKGIQTFLECCDSFNSCGRVLGPLVQTKRLENGNFAVILQRFANKMFWVDYDKAFVEAFAILYSGDNSSREIVTQKIDETIDKYLIGDFTNSTIKYSVANLLKNINDFNPQLQLSESILNKVLELRNKFSDESSYTQRKLLSIRPKRASMTLYDVRNYLEISELIITTSSDPNKIKFEKEKLRKLLRNYMEKLCTNLKKTLTLELKTLVFAVEKLTKNNLISVIPFEGNSWQVNARIKLGFVKETKGKCVGKAIFRDYLDKSGIIYFATILNTNQSSDVLVFLPKNNSAEGVPTCVVYGNDGWKNDCEVVQNIANFVKCSCKYLGYFYEVFDHRATNRPTFE
ncbi:uncharacterized protein LOC103312534 isoform X2 [Tribolium castaneum]|uniref:uncharacterized protein LOC103312534 isoform X2 n=1 Tax=Tribolium castaneum TaxID=7070 RepID=UPI00077DB7E8|nr:PREDICTED: uncharacterized protein LOC103312534 isoform X2 [Tribolium castaneum]|eukprot:XP_015834825.1 PREDICTED: uncharacterized protein LOC103312534 isoform X2 [Tribolium castaneum]